MELAPNTRYSSGSFRRLI